eukprot:COSAG03_NODE_15745_length_421_cov_12.965839_1_plen_58_part_10
MSCESSSWRRLVCGVQGRALALSAVFCRCVLAERVRRIGGGRLRSSFPGVSVVCARQV